MSQQTKSDYVDDVDVDDDWDDHPTDDELEATVENLEASGFDVEVVSDAEEALDVLVSEIPAGASVMNGHSTTLEEIGFDDYLGEGDHDWENLAADIWSIDDDAERDAARRAAQTADYFLGSVNGIAQDGTLVAADLSGSRVGAYPFAAQNLLLVAGVNKVVEDVEAARERLHEFAYAFENERAQEAYGVESYPSKELVYRQEGTEGRTTVVLVEETLGY
ncbi:lactate utilization protein [Halobacterium litoreum]|uniref:Lactate utilization protein n=1 Tax=Halobacterium litoreum TaxID=2039234 RepID=A0ABD5NG74_9EURY|nr:lactate utilization protein [Halobacterium litoreum]UHH13001.1 lactate utilization protein [Halobacterium litoreum]